jgi:hypothetical protein
MTKLYKIIFGFFDSYKVIQATRKPINDNNSLYPACLYVFFFLNPVGASASPLTPLSQCPY